MRTLALALLVTCVGAHAALAHADVAHGREGLRWTFDPWIIGPLSAAAMLYAVGFLLLWPRAGRGRRSTGRHALAYAAGWLSLAGALVSPLHWLGEQVLTFHMIEHEIVMAIAAPLLVLARPTGALLWGMPRKFRFGLVRIARRPLSRTCWDWLTTGRNATMLHGIAIWAWHAPVLFDAAVANVAVHRMQHLSFFATAVLFWWSVLRRSDSGLAAWHLFVTMLHTSILGALMTLAPRLVYGAQTAHAVQWGLSPLQDQQLAGIVMWVPAGAIYAAAALALTAIWITRSSAGLRRNHAA
jgi:putative membrane protein